MSFCFGASTQPCLAQEEDVQLAIARGTEQQRSLRAIISIPQPIEQVWHVLTDYEAMPEFIPNLSLCRRISQSETGSRLEQVGTCQILKVTFSVRVVLDMVEQFPHRIAFRMVEGDFHRFSGSCSLESVINHNAVATVLHYCVNVQPKITMPVALMERQLRSDLPKNLRAIRDRVHTLTS